MKAEKFVKIIGADFYAGVPDSQLRALCDYLINIYGIDPNHHIIAANEGNCVALAAGYHLATGKIPAVYMQNSGEGNIINPVASLLSDQVYAIPMIFIIGWRGEPGIHDEPQHIYQGKVTLKLLEDMDIRFFVIDKTTTDEAVVEAMKEFQKLLTAGKDVAFVIRKGAISYDSMVKYENKNHMIREEAIRYIVKASGGDPIVSTTGKISRELYEIRTSNEQSHKYDFLMVGAMGHSSSTAMGIALNRPEARVWCIDGDGAVLMHMGAMAVIGSNAPKNLIHIAINNGAHETVGGMPTVGGKIDLVSIARACGYPYAVCVSGYDELVKELEAAKEREMLCFIEVKCSLDTREDLGRPSIPPVQNKRNFMEYLDFLGSE